MIRWICSILVLVACSAPVAAKEPDVSRTHFAAWRIKIGADGHVESLDPFIWKANKVLRAAMEPLIRGWKFSPGSINGEPAETVTTLHVVFTLVPDASGQNYNLRFDEVHTGGSPQRLREAPHFPRSEIDRLKRTGQAERVVVDVAYDAQGKVTEVVLAENSPIKSGPFVDAARRDVRTWKYLPETVSGRGVPGRLRVPLCYSVDSSSKCESDADESGLGVSGDLPLAMDSRVKLESDVIGKVL